MSQPRRGEVWLADLNSHTARDEGLRNPAWPCLVIQTDLLNGVGHPSVVVIPGAARTYHESHVDAFPLRVAILRQQEAGGLIRETELFIDQIRAIAQQRLIGNTPLTMLSPEQLQRVQEALQLVLKF